MFSKCGLGTVRCTYMTTFDWLSLCRNDGDIGVDHMYNDLSSFQMTTNTTAECAAACAAAVDGSCHGWVVGNWAPQCGTTLPTCWLKSEMGGNVTLNSCRISGYLQNVLASPAFNTMPVGSISPGGWLQAQLEVQASGLTGYLSHFWEVSLSNICMNACAEVTRLWFSM